MTESRYRVAMVDDDIEDMFATRKGLEQGALDIDFTELSSAESLFAHLRQNPLTLPHLILLDVNMPRMNGFEVLGKLKKTPEWRKIPTIVMSNSGHEADRTKCLNLGAAGFVTKFASMDALTEWGTTLESFLQKNGK